MTLHPRHERLTLCVVIAAVPSTRKSKMQHFPIAIIADGRCNLPNMPIKLSVRPVTPLACASVAPVRPAAYRRRSAELS